MKDDDVDVANMNETGEQRVFARTPAVPFVTPARTVALGAPAGYAEAISAAVAKAEQRKETEPMGPLKPAAPLPFAKQTTVTPAVAVTPVNAVAARAVVWRGAGVLRVTVVVKATFALAHNGLARWIAPAPIVEGDRDRADGLPSELAEASEIAPYVPTAAVLLSGCAHAPNGRATAAMTVRLAVYRENALVDKQIHVFGERDSHAATPRPFEALPIISGRPNFVDARDPRRLAGFGPLARTSPGRLRLLGDVDPAKLEAPQPELARGFDCQFFSAAPADQQTAFLQGDEWIVLDGLHPKLARVQTRLPGAVGKARLNLATLDGTGPSREVGLVADTLVIDAEQMVCSIIWRGHVLVTPEEAASSMQVFAGLELPGQPIAWPEPKSPSWSDIALADTGAVRVLSARSTSADPSDTTGPVDVRQFRREVLPFAGLDAATPPRMPSSIDETAAVDLRELRRAIVPFRAAAARTPATVEPTPVPPIEWPALLLEAPVAVPVAAPAFRASEQVPRPMLGLTRAIEVAPTPPPAPALSAVSPVAASIPEQGDLPLTMYPIERCAAIAASIARRKADKTSILLGHDLTPEVWVGLDTHWREAVQLQVQRGNMTLLRAHDGAYVDQIEAERGPITIDQYAQLTIAMDNGIDQGILTMLDLPRGAVLPAQRTWAEKMSQSKELAERVREAIERATSL
jgi:hypothetical protein